MNNDRTCNYTNVPELTTDRLVLRGHRPADLHDCAQMWADEAITRFIGGRPFSREETWGKMLRYAGLWSLLGYGYWAIEEKATGNFVGEVGFADFKREIGPQFIGVPEVGWVVMPGLQRQGYATEALRTIVSWIDTQLRAARTICLIAPTNVASIRLATRLGYSECGLVNYASSQALVLGRTANNFAAS